MSDSKINASERLMRGYADAVLQALGFLAPERASELNAKILEGNLRAVNYGPGKANFLARIKSDEIYITYPALLSLWATAQAAVLIGNKSIEARNSGVCVLDASPGGDVANALDLLEFAKSLIRDPNTDWPENLPTPNAGAENGTPDWYANNMFLAAAGWILLHEFAHFYLKHELDTTDALMRSQEHEADQWAVNWILEHAPNDNRIEFRVFAISIGFVWIGLVDEVRRGSVDHPHAWDRFERCTKLIEDKTGELSPGLQLASYIIKACFFPYEPIEASNTARDAFFETLFQASRLPR